MRLVKLRDILQPMTTKDARKLPEEFFRYIDVDAVEPNHTGVILPKELSVNEAPSRAKREVRKGDIIISLVRAYQRKIAIITEKNVDCVASTAFYVCRPSEELDSNYLFHFLGSNVATKYLETKTQGDNSPSVKNEDFLELEIPLLGITEQKRISAILDKSKDLIKKRKEAIAQLDKLEQALFLEMFGDPLRNPKRWDIVKLPEICSRDRYSIKAGPFGSALKKEFYVEKGYKIYGQEQVIRDDLSYGNYYIDEKKYKELESNKVEAGDILISLVGTFGKVSVVPEKFEEGIINPRLMKITVDKNKTNPFFLKKMLESEAIKAKLLHMSHGGTMGIINVGIMKELELPWPPLDLQNKFVEAQDFIKKQKHLNQISLQNLEEAFQSLLQRAFKGELHIHTEVIS